MGNGVVTEGFVNEKISNLGQRMEKEFSVVRREITQSQSTLVYWMIGIFLAATALFSTAVGVYTMAVLSRP